MHKVVLYMEYLLIMTTFSSSSNVALFGNLNAADPVFGWATGVGLSESVPSSAASVTTASSLVLDEPDLFPAKS